MDIKLEQDVRNGAFRVAEEMIRSLSEPIGQQDKVRFIQVQLENFAAAILEQAAKQRRLND